MESVLKPSKPRCGLTGNGNSIVTRHGFHQNCMSFLMKNSRIAFQITLISCTEKICRELWHFQFVCWCWSECDVTSGTLAMAAIVRLFVDSQRLIAWCQNRTKCVKYVWLSYPTWPSRWVLCISMQWLRLKGCHVACNEWTSGEICSLQQVSHRLCHVGSREWRVTKIWGPRCDRD